MVHHWYEFGSMTAAAIPVPKEALQQPFNLPGFKLMTFMHEHYEREPEEELYNEYHGAIICLADTELLFSTVYAIGPYTIPRYQASCKSMKHLDAFMPAGTREILVSAFEKYTGRKPDVVPGFWAIGSTSQYRVQLHTTWSLGTDERIDDGDCDTFGFAVEQDADGSDADFKWLKYKVDQGADFIVTQLFYGMVLFLDWIKECRTRGIAVPTIPNIMPIESFGGFGRMTSRCNAFVLERIKNALEPFKEDDQAVKDFGVKLAVEMYKGMQAGGISGLHVYILNFEKPTCLILEGFDFVAPRTSTRPLPWNRSLSEKREKNVRPIFWKIMI
ncbi:hypothetical protein KI688_003669 [Linnemannia hyalina]|uniref:Methylenetetrahydrofolate reductase (NAD(P)H) n=1 Tax=Linnemannia hyalina TaxID=64524 RepID=A0A9P8BQ27_9FUNG|nr:hypothetical protein KI688_003669 [Linnemannia hyalina]